MNTKITLPQLVDALSQLTGCSECVSEAFIKELFSLITDALSRGESVNIKNLGVFSRIDSQSNPVQFEPCKDIADAINTPFAFFEPVELDDNISENELNEVSSEDNPDERESGELEVTQELDVDDYNESITTQEISIDSNDELNNQSTTTIIEEEVMVDISQEEPLIEIHQNEKIDAETEPNASSPKKYKFILGMICGIIIGLVLGYVCSIIYLNNRENSSVNTSENVSLMDTLTTNIDSIAYDSIEHVSTEKTISVIEYQEIYDTIRANRYLTTMARQYFGEMNFWVYIYEENKDHLTNPDKIKPGTPIRIPDAKKYNINANDSASIERAKLKAIEIYRPYR